jgi:hypothetical protein
MKNLPNGKQAELQQAKLLAAKEEEENIDLHTLDIKEWWKEIESNRDFFKPNDAFFDLCKTIYTGPDKNAKLQLLLTHTNHLIATDGDMRNEWNTYFAKHSENGQPKTPDEELNYAICRYASE